MDDIVDIVVGPNKASGTQAGETTNFGCCEVRRKTGQHGQHIRIKFETSKIGRVWATVMIIFFGNRDILFIYIY